MPHIIYHGTADLKELHRRFTSSKREDNGWILRLQQVFLASDARSVLLDAVAVRSGFSQHFYILAEQKSDSLTIRVDPHTNVEKNEGVRRALVWARDLIVEISPQMVFERSNLSAELLRLPPSE